MAVPVSGPHGLATVQVSKTAGSSVALVIKRELEAAINTHQTTQHDNAHYPIVRREEPVHRWVL